MVARRKRTVLVVDDDHDSRAVLSRLLQQEGFRVLLAGNGQQAMRRTQVVIPDAIVCDLRMPVMDGKTFAALLKKRPALFGVPLIAITAYGIEEVGDIDVDEVMHKPLDFERLIDKLDELLRRGRRRPKLGELHVLNGTPKPTKS